MQINKYNCIFTWMHVCDEATKQSTDTHYSNKTEKAHWR